MITLPVLMKSTWDGQDFGSSQGILDEATSMSWS